MLSLFKRKFLIVFAINFIIALAYYVDNLKANYSELSSDIQNIIPVAQKFDDPSLFEKDLYLDKLDNVRYYTPFYVQSLRFLAKFTNGNYLQAVNILGLICHLLFGILWFFLIYKYTNYFWVSLILSVFLRGIVWLPGLEIWGISDLWSIMPRTLYIALMPIPFLVLSKKLSNLLLASFLIGLVFNFHPITGLGGILLFCSMLILAIWFFKLKTLINIKTVLGIGIFLLIGMMPFILTYFGKTSAKVNYNIADYIIAFNRRIPSYFNDPFYFLKEWLHFKTLIYLMPLIVYLWISRTNKEAFNKAKLLFILMVVLIVVPLLSIPVEQFLNKSLNLNLRLSFQLVRMQKVAILPGIFAIAFLLVWLVKKYKKASLAMPAIFFIYIFFLAISHASVFNSFPFVGDDLSRSILPSNLSAFISSSGKIPADKMADYIKENTAKDALFCASSGFYRGSAKRSTVLDSKGASMIIEGNPAKFIEWSKQQEEVMALDSKNTVVEYLRKLKVDYFITPDNTITNAKKVHTEGHINLYKL